MESSAEADATRILEARNKTEDTQRRLNNEKAEHAATAGLLEEEQGKYERCRSRLETSQEHLADLNERFNEMRAEVEVRRVLVHNDVGVRFTFSQRRVNEAFCPAPRPSPMRRCTCCVSV